MLPNSITLKMRSKLTLARHSRAGGKSSSCSHRKIRVLWGYGYGWLGIFLSMFEGQKTVFILGAGFTRAFATNAPLLSLPADDLSFPALQEKYRGFPNILKILQISTDSDQRVNIENMLTRLSSGMPFDSDILTEAERKLLLDDVKENFFGLIRGITIDAEKETVLKSFSKKAIEDSASFVTFNYDTLLDEYLWKEKQLSTIPESGTKYFHTDGGYGFFCRPASSLVGDKATAMDRCTSFVYKLHGSLNWRIKIGAKSPYTIDSLVHDEGWLMRYHSFELTDDDKSAHLEKHPFIINPILDKSEINGQSILKVVWSVAYKKIQEADRVVFIGYSLPKTDIAARFLFKEALTGKDSNNIFIVGKSENIKESYKDLLPDLPDEQFSFDGAENWIQDKYVSVTVPELPPENVDSHHSFPATPPLYNVS